MEEKFRLLLSTIHIFSSNMRVLHWNVKGLEWNAGHETMQEYYEMLDKDLDKVAEIGMQLNVIPVSIQEALEIADKSSVGIISLKGTDNFTIRDCWKYSQDMFNVLIDLVEKAKTAEGVPGDITSELETLQNVYRLEARYKLKGRIG